MFQTKSSFELTDWDYPTTEAYFSYLESLVLVKCCDLKGNRVGCMFICYLLQQKVVLELPRSSSNYEIIDALAEEIKVPAFNIALAVSNLNREAPKTIPNEGEAFCLGKELKVCSPNMACVSVN